MNLELNAFQEVISNFKSDLFKSKKYWILYVVLVLLASFSMFGVDNYAHPKMEIGIILLSSILGVFCITYFHGHNNDKELFKAAFIVILTFGIISSFMTPICLSPDEVEHFVRSEMTSRGEFIPIYENNTFLTIQSTLDLIEDSKETVDTGFDRIHFENASIFKTDADTKPINNTLVEYPSAFAQNPFFGYLPQAIGMLVAKLLDLNAVWLLWLGRIFNVVLYASLVSIAIKKTPILKIPLLAVSLIPLCIFQAASLSIDSMVNGLGILMAAYFFYMYKSPKNTLTKKDILIFGFIGLLLGLCKLTYFAFIFLLLFVPRDNFLNKKIWYFSLITIMVLGIGSLLWTKFYANPAFFESFRLNYWQINNINSTEQISYILIHKKDTIIHILNFPKYFDVDLLFNSRTFGFNMYNSFYLMFLGAICLLYPTEKFNWVNRLGAFCVVVLIYFGTYLSFLLTWTPVGQLDNIVGVQPRYFLPLFVLFPFIFGINNIEGDKASIDEYVFMISIAFLAVMLLSSAVSFY